MYTRNMVCFRYIIVSTLHKSDNKDDDDDDNNNKHDRVCAQLHFNICKETGVQFDKNTGMNMCQNQ